MSGISNITQGLIYSTYSVVSTACSLYTTIKAYEVGNQALSSGIFKPQNELCLFSTFGYQISASLFGVGTIFHAYKAWVCFNIVFSGQNPPEYKYDRWDIVFYGMVPVAGLYLLIRRNQSA